MSGAASLAREASTPGADGRRDTDPMPGWSFTVRQPTPGLYRWQVFSPASPSPAKAWIEGTSATFDSAKTKAQAAMRAARDAAERTPVLRPADLSPPRWSIEVVPGAGLWQWNVYRPDQGKRALVAQGIAASQEAARSAAAAALCLGQFIDAAPVPGAAHPIPATPPHDALPAPVTSAERAALRLRAFALAQLRYADWDAAARYAEQIVAWALASDGAPL